ncbi:MAG: TAXI family TRAP transporter solute-binding subunit [Rhodocyclaceae bacterium]|nr:TAXI family TRAP transporter solute-binding subunit [Rhodocyclaceae bacterium]
MALAFTVLAAPSAGYAQTRHLTFSGGPEGGTFQFLSNGISALLSRKFEGTEITDMASAGSVENLRRVHAKEADFGIVYSGDLYLGVRGSLAGDANAYTNVQVISYLYGAPAHLIVHEDSGITEVAQLAGKRVAVGPSGSGAATSAQRFFESLGMWDRIQPQFVGYLQGASALAENQVDALWAFAGLPNASVIRAASHKPIRLLQVFEPAQRGALLKEHPYYTRVTIPAGTYPGVDYDVHSIQDSALWVAGRHVPEDLAYRSLATVYSGEGLEFMHAMARAAREMAIRTGLTGVVTPVHQGARKFWTEQGFAVSDAQR